MSVTVTATAYQEKSFCTLNFLACFVTLSLISKCRRDLRLASTFDSHVISCQLVPDMNEAIR